MCCGSRHVLVVSPLKELYPRFWGTSYLESVWDNTEKVKFPPHEFGASRRGKKGPKVFSLAIKCRARRGGIRARYMCDHRSSLRLSLPMRERKKGRMYLFDGMHLFFVVVIR